LEGKPKGRRWRGENRKRLKSHGEKKPYVSLEESKKRRGKGEVAKARGLKTEFWHLWEIYQEAFGGKEKHSGTQGQGGS